MEYEHLCTLGYKRVESLEVDEQGEGEGEEEGEGEGELEGRRGGDMYDVDRMRAYSENNLHNIQTYVYTII